MEMSVREARSHFAAALSAAERGERVTINKHGKAIAELGPPTPEPVLDWEKMKRVSADLGIARPSRPLDDDWRREFDDPVLSHEVLGLRDEADEQRLRHLLAYRP